MEQGIYEQLITHSIQQRIEELDTGSFFINETIIDKEDAARILAAHIFQLLYTAFNSLPEWGIKKEALLEKQIELSNKLIALLQQELPKADFSPDIIKTQGKLLKAIYAKLNFPYPDFDSYLKRITPYSTLSQSELFTGGNAGISLESELKKEIVSANRIDLLVSFIKWKGIVILLPAFKEFIGNGGQLRVITTTYLGATDAKAIEELAALGQTQVRISYNNANERLHAKAYLFHRDTGFHTGYIGSSNFSRSALTDGLEWNLKITTKEVPHIISKFQRTFESYWQNPEFEIFENTDEQRNRLSNQLSINKTGKTNASILSFFHIKPYHYQAQVLEQLAVERNLRNNYRNLVVAATGTGKTLISAFDYLAFKKDNTQHRLLFIAHRQEILVQARSMFRQVLIDANFGELWFGGKEPEDCRFVFATVPTLVNRLDDGQLSAEYYDYVVVDEAHHISAASYQKLIQFFKPKILLGLTATPERMDGNSILPDFCNTIAAEIRLPEALNNKLLTPFHYFGVSDTVDLTDIRWSKGKYDPAELTKVYTANDHRVTHIIKNLEQYTKNIHEVIALGFCVSIEHAQFMSQKFQLAGLKAHSLTSANQQDRTIILNDLKNGTIQYLFVVDIFNEGVDIPQVDTILFLRPTESLTIFLQQFGRGLRLHHGKEVLTVLDFVGNARPEYRFDAKFRALVGKTNSPILKEIEKDFPHLPLGCAIVLEKKAKAIILNNIKAATQTGKKELIRKLLQFPQETTLPLNLANFLTHYGISLNELYKRGSWTELCAEAGILYKGQTAREENYKTLLARKWMVTNSSSYFSFLLTLAKKGFEISESEISDMDRGFLLMLYHDFFSEIEIKNFPSDQSLAERIALIGLNPDYLQELTWFLEIKLAQVDFLEIPVEGLPYILPLKAHARYTRDQILAAFQMSTLHRKFPSREGLAETKPLNTELFFVNLEKTEDHFSPTTMYEDYAISDTLFHWQTQNSTSAESAKGQTYIHHQQLGKKLFMFVREAKLNEYDHTQGYVFIGPVIYQSHEGSKPMSITWQLPIPLPNYLWKETAKLLVG